MIHTTPAPTPEELQADWKQRVANGTFSAAVVGTREVRVFGRAGDVPVAFPQIRALADGETSEMVIKALEPDERWALTHAQTIVEEHARDGRLLSALKPDDTGEVMSINTIDPQDDTNILVLNQIAGG